MTVTLAPADLDALVGVAEDTLRRALRGDPTRLPDPSGFSAPLREPGAAFVTLRRDERLLGCVGTLEPVDPLVTVVAQRTISAAFHDPRTSGVRAGDFAHLHIEVSVLTPMEPFTVASYDALVAYLAVRREGLVVEAGRHRATFLPAVWEQLVDPPEFVGQLWRKAGLPRRAWPEDIRLHRYSAIKAYGAPPRAAL